MSSEARSIGPPSRRDGCVVLRVLGLGLKSQPNVLGNWPRCVFFIWAPETQRHQNSGIPTFPEKAEVRLRRDQYNCSPLLKLNRTKKHLPRSVKVNSMFNSFKQAWLISCKFGALFHSYQLTGGWLARKGTASGCFAKKLNPGLSICHSTKIQTPKKVAKVPMSPAT